MTKTEICNRALALLGHDRMVTDIDATEGGQYVDQSTEAMRCRQFFGAALSDCLAEHDWDFAAVERNLGGAHADADGWARFPVPVDSIRIIGVFDIQMRPMRTRRARDFIEVQTLGEPMTMRYISSEVDVTTLPHKFGEALVYMLASMICGPMFGEDKKAEGYTNLAMRKLSDAMTKETDETAYRGKTENPFLTARK